MLREGRTKELAQLNAFGTRLMRAATAIGAPEESAREWLRRALGLGSGTLSKWMTGDELNKIPLDALRRMRDLLSVRIDFLAFGEDPMEDLPSDPWRVAVAEMAEQHARASKPHRPSYVSYDSFLAVREKYAATAREENWSSNLWFAHLQEANTNWWADHQKREKAPIKQRRSALAEVRKQQGENRARSTAKREYRKKDLLEEAAAREAEQKANSTKTKSVKPA